MKKIATVFIALMSVLNLQAQVDKKSDDLQKDLKRKVEAKDEGWKKGGLINIGINQGIFGKLGCWWRKTFICCQWSI
ncbi:MAG: hypothetical protein IPJ31_03590 [Bacteroidetes bacterium]|nr:hypothetical protein [Bacteroidota bacterium]